MVPSRLLGMLGSNQTSVYIMQSQQLYLQSHMLSKLVSWSYLLVNPWAKIVLALSIWMSILFFISILLFLHTWVPFLSGLVLPPMSWQSWTHPRKILQQLTGNHLWRLFKSLLIKLPNMWAKFMLKMSQQYVPLEAKYLDSCNNRNNHSSWAMLLNLPSGNLCQVGYRQIMCWL